MTPSRPVSWVKAARRDFEAFPPGARLEALRALTVAAEGGKADIAKPLNGLDGGVFEIVLRLGDDLWVVHAFQKKSKTGIKTPKAEIDLIRERLKQLKEMLP